MGRDCAKSSHGDSAGNHKISQRPSQRGAEAEEAAARYLVTKGLHIRQRNFLCRLGEIDIVASTHQELVFVEVRMRNHHHYGSGADSVTIGKQRKICRAARYYLHKHGTTGPNGTLPLCRFDVLSMRQPGYPLNAKWRIEWIQDAFEAI